MPSGMKILVAEDSPSFALLYKNALGKRGHEVTVTTNGMDCVYKYADEFKIRYGDKEKSSGYDLVILDHKMPRMKGIDVAKEIIEMNPTQRILIVTGHVKDMMKGIRAVGEKVELLQKPFPSLAMIRQVEGLTRFRWVQKMVAKGGPKEWDGETGFSDPI